MELARKEALELVIGDPELKEDRHRLLRLALLTRFKDIYAPVKVRGNEAQS